MENSYLKAKQLVLKKYNEDYEYFPLLVLGLYGIITKFSDYYDLIEDIFLRVDINIINESISNYLINNNINNVELNDKNSEDNLAFANNGNNYFYDKKEERFIKEINNPIIVINKSNMNNTILLNTFIHEFSHLIKSSINNDKINKDYYIERNGLSFYRFKKNKLFFREDLKDSSFDECINVLQTTDMMNYIKELDGIIPDDDINNCFNTIDKDLMIKDYGYDDIVYEVRDLWENEEFKKLIEDNIVTGKINIIRDNFNEITGLSYNKFGKCLDNIEDIMSDYYVKNKLSIKQLYKLKESIIYIRKVIKIFNNNCKVYKL